MLALIFLIAALVCLIVAALGVQAGKVNLLAAGLACYVAAQLIPRAGVT